LDNTNYDQVRELKNQINEQQTTIQQLESKLETLTQLAEKEITERDQTIESERVLKKSLTDQTQNLKNQRNIFQTRYTTQKNELNETTETVTDLQNQLIQEQKDYRDLTQELTEQDDLLSIKNSQLTQLISEQTQSVDEIINLTAQIKTNQNQGQELKNYSTQKEKEIKKLTKQLELIQKKLLRGKTYQQNQINNLSHQKTKQQEIIAEQKADLNLLTTQRNKFSRDYLRAKKELQKQEILIAELENELRDKEKQKKKETKTFRQEIRYLKGEKEELAKLLIQAKNKHRQLAKEKGRAERAAEARSFLLQKYRSKFRTANSEISVLKGEKLNLENKVDNLRDIKSELYTKLRTIKQAQKNQAQKAQDQKVCQDLIIYQNISED
jgi:chromosome segregation ATPase